MLDTQQCLKGKTNDVVGFRNILNCYLCDNLAVSFANHTLNRASTTVQVMITACLQKILYEGLLNEFEIITRIEAAIKPAVVAL